MGEGVDEFTLGVEGFDIWERVCGLSVFVKINAAVNDGSQTFGVILRPEQ